MKLRQLHLQAFGPFTDQLLDFAAGPQGLHIVFGPNEAGKSSALRALRGFFYGIESRSSDNFIHPYPKLRIGATLQTADGQVLELVRRKGRTKTLRDGDDANAVDEAVLSTLLGGVDEASFARRYGIGYDDLVQGGRDLLSGGGDLSQSLFAAASGVANLNAAQTQLAADSSKLFKERGSNPEINAAISQWNKLQKQIKADLLPTATWRQHDQALSEAQKQRESVRQQTNKKVTRRSLLERLHRAIPIAARRQQIQDDLLPLEQTPLLPDDFAEQRRGALTALEVANSALNDATKDIETLNVSLEALQSPGDILQNAAAITQLQQRLGSHLTAMEHRQLREAERKTALAAAKAILKELGREDVTLEKADQLGLKPSERIRIADLGNAKGELVAGVKNARQRIDELNDTHDAVQRQLENAPSTRDGSTLKTALAQVREAEHSEKQLDQLLRDQRAAESDRDVELKKLRGWSGTLSDLEQIALPADESLNRFEQQLAEARQDLKAIRERQTDASEEAGRLDEQIEQLRRVQDVPTEGDLSAARSRRDEQWHKLCSRLVDGSAGADETSAYADAVAEADQISDRLRREAKQVAEKAQLLARRDTVEQRLKTIASQREQAQDAQQQVQTQWFSLWSPLNIEPLSPREMHVWLRQAQALCEAAVADRQRRQTIAQLKTELESWTAVLETAFEAVELIPTVPASSLRQLISFGEAALAEIEEGNRLRAAAESQQGQLQRDLEKAKRTLAKATKELESWAEQWGQAIASLQLREGAEPHEANATIEAIKDLLDHNKEAETLAARISGIDRDAEAFRADVDAICSIAAPILAGQTVEQVVTCLADSLTSARAADTERKTIEKQLAAAKRRHDDAHVDRQQAGALLNALCAEAGCSSPEDLPAVERQSDHKSALQRDDHEKLERLTELAAGEPLNDFLTTLSQYGADEVAQELRELEDEIELLAEQGSELDQSIGEERMHLAQMDGNARAAEARQELEQLLAKIRSDAQQYARLHLADVVLQAAMERYRRQHEGPVLQRASELFATLTIERFTALQADLDDGGKPVLVGIRDNGEAVHVDGMSDGTCDQLYLALRLASLETDLAHREPLPFIVDDVLIKFDDDRAVATLKVLAALAEKTQVIMFTHHEHLVTLARETLDDEMLLTHTLDSRRQLAAV